MRIATALRRLLRGRKVLVMPHDARSLPRGAHSPHLHFDTGHAVLSEHIDDYVSTHGRDGFFLDIGGGEGLHSFFAGPLTYRVLDIENERPGAILGDICNCPQIDSSSVDIAFSHNTLEHIHRPWLAAREIGRILKPGGLACVMTCFGTRYHPVPKDYWRFTHSALELLFEEEGGLTTLASGYDLLGRRDDRNDKIEGHLDLAPVDDLGGWLENWGVWYVGRKP